MIGASILKSISTTVINDESLCRLIIYGEKPLDEDKEDLTTKSGHETLMREIIKFTPQVSELFEKEGVRLFIYKDFTKLGYGGKEVLQDAIQFDIYIPHRIADMDFRVYDIENRIVSLIDKTPIGIGYLEYTDGHFIQLPPVTGYTQYRMTFTVKEGRPINYARR